MKYMGHEVLQALKTRNAINRANPGRMLQYKLRNVSVNGQKRGCVGHVTDLSTGACVFINTERSVMVPHDMLYREAKNEQDFSGLGFVNNWANTLEELVEGVTRLLGTQKKKEEDSMAKKQVKKEESMKVKFEKCMVWRLTVDGVEEVPGYRFKAELKNHPEVEDFHFWLAKVRGGWKVYDTYTGKFIGTSVYATRDAAAKDILDNYLSKYDACFMSEMHEAQACDFQAAVAKANEPETKEEQVKKPENKKVKKPTAKKPEAKVEPEVVEAVATETLSFIDGDAESAEKVMAELRKLMDGGNVVVRWKGKPLAPIRVEGDTKPYQKELKERGLRWARKGFWYLKPTAC